MVMSVDAEKTFDKYQHSFMIKSSQYTKNRGKFPNSVKTIYKNLIANITLNS